MSDLIRLQKYLAAGGVASRRAAEKLIEAGKVKVNGKVVKKLGVKIDALHDIIEVDNSVITVPDKKQYYLLNKPKGYLTTVWILLEDRQMDLFPQELRKGLFPVGRLDLDTEGLLLVTNDGETAFRLTHPRFKIKKKYIARVKGIPREKDLQQFKKGILLEDGPTSPADAAIISTDKSNALLQITLHEGKKRQIKRMCKTLGYPVLSLKRTAIAFLKLHGLRPGGYRTLTPLEINKLATLLGLKV